MNAAVATYREAHATARRHAAETSSQLRAARTLRLGGTAGRLPRGYFSDAPRSAARSASSEASAEPTPQSR